jgi:hypothetical protein
MALVFDSCVLLNSTAVGIRGKNSMNSTYGGGFLPHCGTGRASKEAFLQFQVQRSHIPEATLRGNQIAQLTITLINNKKGSLSGKTKNNEVVLNVLNHREKLLQF